MKSIFYFLSIFGFLCFHLQAQEKDKKDTSFIRLIALVGPGEGPTYFKINGYELWKKGYKTGQRTGPIGYRPGKYKIEVRKKGCTSAKIDLDFPKGETQTAVAYAEPVYDENGKLIEWEIKVARLRQHTPEKGIWATIISFCPEKELPLVVNEVMAEKKTEHTLYKKQSKRIYLGEGQISARMFIEGEKICQVVDERTGNHVIMLYETEEGRKALQFYDPKFQVAN